MISVRFDFVWSMSKLLNIDGPLFTVDNMLSSFGKPDQLFMSKDTYDLFTKYFPSTNNDHKSKN